MDEFNEVTPSLLEKICPEYKALLIQRMREGCVVVGECKIWQKATNSAGYPVIKITVPGWGRKTVLAHRLIFQLVLNIDIDAHHNKEVSHLCHQERCLHVPHLSFETAAVNCSRKHCKESGACSGHDSYPPCIL